MSIASDIAAAIAARLAGITKANGYATDIGLRVFRGKRRLDEGNVPCVVIFEGDDTPKGDSLRSIIISQRYQVEGHAQCDPDHPNDRAHEIIADLKRALFQGEYTLGVAPRYTPAVKRVDYVGRVIATREDGLEIVAATVTVDVTYTENVTTP